MPIEAAELESTLEQGEVTFLYRPRVERYQPEELADVQRLLILLAPGDSPFQRVIAVGRKRLPPSQQRQRFWGFVDLVLTQTDMEAALADHVYVTKNLGRRHLPAARPVAGGSYELSYHRDHAHLRWTIQSSSPLDPIAAELDLERTADYLVMVANPDLAVWGLEKPPDLQQELFDELELHVPVPTPFPPGQQRRFGSRRYHALDDAGWLDHPGAELVFIGSGSAG